MVVFFFVFAASIYLLPNSCLITLKSLPTHPTYKINLIPLPNGRQLDIDNYVCRLSLHTKI